MFKMRGLTVTLLCLFGLTFTKQTQKETEKQTELYKSKVLMDSDGGFAPPTINPSKLPPGIQTPMEGDNGSNKTTNSSTELEKSRQNVSAQWNGTFEADDDSDGFPPTEGPKGGTVPLAKKGTDAPKRTTKAPPLIWHPLNNDSGFPTEPTPRKVIQGKQ